MINKPLIRAFEYVAWRAGLVVVTIPHDSVLQGLTPWHWSGFRDYWLHRAIQEVQRHKYVNSYRADATHVVITTSETDFFEATYPRARYNLIRTLRYKHCRVYASTCVWHPEYTQSLVALANKIEGTKYDIPGLIPFLLDDIAKLPSPIKAVSTAGKIASIPAVKRLLYKGLNVDSAFFCSEAVAALETGLYKEYKGEDIPYPAPFTFPGGGRQLVEMAVPADYENWPHASNWKLIAEFNAPE